MKGSENISAEKDFNDINNEHSCIQTKMEKMRNYHAVEVNGREITKMKRIDREYKLYEERIKESNELY